MWLINTTTLELCNFIDARSAPPYAILSHCWGPEEMSFQDFRKKRNCKGLGYEKILNCCRYVRQLDVEMFRGRTMSGFDWVWVDTVCIDKRSSAELSEAINSMYNWYQRAIICVAFLVDTTANPGTKLRPNRDISRSRWFTRGWTLQELIAPRAVVFVDSRWEYLGEKCGHMSAIEGGFPIDEDLKVITGVPGDVLADSRVVEGYSVAQRLSWASRRSTTRVEDEAYCLLGLFGIHMPLIYGEGRRAFQRLQIEILNQLDDDSVYAISVALRTGRMLASSPTNFAGSQDVVRLAGGMNSILSTVGAQWRIVLSSWALPRVFYDTEEDGPLLVRLRCGIPLSASERSPCLLLLKRASCGHYFRATHEENGPYAEFAVPMASRWKPAEGPATIYIHNSMKDVISCTSVSWSNEGKDMRLFLGTDSPGMASEDTERATT